MATYRVGDVGYFRDLVQFKAGETVTIPDEERPSYTFFPLDKAAKAAMAKHWPKVKWQDYAPPEPAPAEPEVATLFERQKKGRAADMEPV